MEELLKDFLKDLEYIQDAIDLIKLLNEANTIKIEEEIDKEKYKGLISIHNKAKSCNVALKIMLGIIYPYLGGRFENFVRNIFEELCSSIANEVKSYSGLPKIMKKNLLEYTAEVIANPRKYGHGEKGVESFIKVLSENINNNDVTAINAACLSITYENMRADMLKSLFERVGMKDIWVTMSEQIDLKLFLKQTNSEKAKSIAEKHLNEFMSKRNMIAHPSNDITWPSEDEVKFYIEYFKKVSKTLVDVCELQIVNYQNVDDSITG